MVFGQVFSQKITYLNMADIAGILGIIVFYLLILFVGIYAAWLKNKRKAKDERADESIIVGGRDIGLFVGTFTMIATWVGGGYINGTAEYVYLYGLVYAQAPIGYALSLLIGGLFFAGTMRERKYLTMIDPFQEKYGRYIGGLMYFPALCGEVLWTAAILNALGASVSVILDLNFTVSIVISACIAIFYTFIGGLYSVAYTDVVQLLCIAFGLSLCLPFAWHDPLVDWSKAAVNFTSGVNLWEIDWFGKIESDSVGSYVDTFLLLIFGGLPWQVYFQRVLSTKTVFRAKILSIVASLGCILLAIPAILVGVVARYTDWNTIYNSTQGIQWAQGNASLVLPAVIKELTPPVVTFFGLGAVSAAVMSSSDSSVLSASSMFAHNIYKEVIMRGKASDTSTIWVLRCCVVVIGAVSCVIGILVGSVAYLWWLCSDLVYVILFPQLLTVIYYSRVNSYGALLGYCVGLVVRLLGGEKGLHFPPVIDYSTNFPYKTFAMLCNLMFIFIGSEIARLVFKKLKVDKTLDVLRAFPEETVQKVNWQELWNVDKGTRFTRERPVSEMSDGVGNMSFQTDV